MKCTFATYEHSTLGFPRVKLKWSAHDGRWSSPYVTVGAIIQRLPWSWHHPHPEPFATDEMQRFDKWVRETYSHDASVQG